MPRGCAAPRRVADRGGAALRFAANDHLYRAAVWFNVGFMGGRDCRSPGQDYRCSSHVWPTTSASEMLQNTIDLVKWKLGKQVGAASASSARAGHFLPWFAVRRRTWHPTNRSCSCSSRMAWARRGPEALSAPDRLCALCADRVEIAANSGTPPPESTHYPVSTNTLPELPVVLAPATPSFDGSSASCQTPTRSSRRRPSPPTGSSSCSKTPGSGCPPNLQIPGIDRSFLVLSTTRGWTGSWGSTGSIDTAACWFGRIASGPSTPCPSPVASSGGSST